MSFNNKTALPVYSDGSFGGGSKNELQARMSYEHNRASYTQAAANTSHKDSLNRENDV